MMNESAFNLVRQSVIGNTMTDDERQLELLRITRDKQLPEMQFLFRIFGKPCFPRGELVAVTGKAKSGKTLFTSMLMACCVKDEVLQVQRPFTDVDGVWQSSPIRCLWYDTEQSEQSTQDILKNRVLRIVGGHTDPTDPTDLKIPEKSVSSVESVCPKKTSVESVRSACPKNTLSALSAVSACPPKILSVESVRSVCPNNSLSALSAVSACPKKTSVESVCDYFDVFNVRSLHYEVRLRLFETAVRRYHPDLVLLDGVRDLLADINDGVKAQEIVERLMKLAQETACCLVCVLHQNKGAEDRNLRGWIGTELMNKAFEVYSCEKVKPEDIFVVEQTHTRKYTLGELLFFRMDDDTELPVICDAPSRYAATGSYAGMNVLSGEKLPYMNKEWLTFDENNKPHPKREELFCEALKNGPLYYSDLQVRVMNLLNCGTQMWNNMFREMRDKGFIVRSKNHEGKAVWTLRSSQSAKPALQQPDMFDALATDSGDSPSS